jgi:hypothetical protein
MHGHRRGGPRVIDRIRGMIIIPMALHPTFYEEAMIQLRCFLENHFLRTAQIALQDYLDKHCLPPATADGKVAVEMAIRLPSPETPPSCRPAGPAFMIKPAVPSGEAN